ncbi:MAG: phosphate regulon sensor histidine kinase PhoR [Betaproteobacteria bacterium]|nr:phosphate regulon sensor histidine kinase PhoR [Betaproteobacteria bacterium]
MTSVWMGALSWFGAVCFLGLTVGAFAGQRWGLASIAVALLALCLHHLRNLRRLQYWAIEPNGTPVPDAPGVWGEVFSSLNRRTRKAAAVRSELEIRLRRFLDASQAMPDGVVVLNRQNAIEWMNASAEGHFGLDHRKDLGAPIGNLVRQPAFVHYLDSGAYGEPVELRSLRDPRRALSIQIIEFGIDRKLLLSRDISQLHRLETMRRDFVANVSHELKTPLTVVTGFIETLQDTLPELTREEATAYLAMAHDQALRMQRLVEDLLTLSALETDSPPGDERTDVAELIEDLAEEAAALSAGRHHIEVEAAAGAVLLGSARELRSALANLVSNAVRYTPEGGHIRLLWQHGPEGGRFTVEDDGIGIDARDIPRLTERFYRVDRGRSRETGGTGLGLAIVKHVLNRHQASLHIESEPGRGSRFTARFPARRVQRLPDAAQSSPDRNPPPVPEAPPVAG